MYRRIAAVLILFACLVAPSSPALMQSGGSVQQALQDYFSAHVAPLYAGATQFTFAVTGDIHVSHGATFVLTKTEWQNLLTRWRDAGHAFGVVVGDLGYGDAGGLADVAAGWTEVPAAPRIFYAMGNHETDDPSGKRGWIDALYPGAVPASVWTPTISSPGNSDRAYWSFNVGPYWRFVMLDANVVGSQTGVNFDGTLTTGQLAWLKADLAANPNRNVMVFVHEPIDQAKYDTPYYTLNDRGPFMDILAAHPKQTFIFSGHLHGYRGITKWRGITSVHTSDTAPTGTSGVTVAINGEVATIGWAGMTPDDTVDYDHAPMYSATVEGPTTVLRIGEDGGDYGRTRGKAMSTVGAQNGITPTSGSLMLKAGPIDWYDSYFISEQLIKIVPGMTLSYDIQLSGVSGGRDAVAVQPGWVMVNGGAPPVVTDQNGIALSTRPRDGSGNLYYDDLPSLGGRATGQWYRRVFDLTPLAGNYVDGVLLGARAMGANVGAVYVDNIALSWPTSACGGTLSPDARTIGAAGGSDVVSVAAAGDCAWTAISNVPWAAVTGGTSGTGNGAVSYTVLDNPGTAGRFGTLTIVGQTFSIAQDGRLLDTIPPSVAIHAPGPNAALSGTVSVAAVADDEGGIGGVQFLLDGADLGAEIRTAPYTIQWDSAAAPNGAHVLSARARDAAGNVTLAAPVPVTVSNAAQPLSPAIDVVAVGDRGMAATTVATSAFSTASANELLLAFVAADDLFAGNTVTGIEGGGLAWTLVRRTNTERGTAEIWRAFAAARLSGATVTATLAQSVQSSIVVVAFSGVDTSGSNGSGAVGATASASAPSGAPTATLTTTRTDAWVFGVGVDWDTATPRIVGPNQTKVHEFLAPVGDTYWVQRTNAPTAVAGTAVVINDTAPVTDRYNFTLCEVLPPAAPDAEPPTVALTAPADGARVSGPVVVSASASDNGAVAGVQFQLDGVSLTAEDSAAPYSVNWDTTASANGSHTLTAIARDAAGNTTLTDAITVVVDNDVTPPAVSLTAPAAGATVSGSVTVSAQASDNVGVAGVQFHLDGASLGEDTTSPFTFSWNSAGVTNGIHTLRADARDAAGNVTQDAIAVTVSNVAAAPTSPTIDRVAFGNKNSSSTTVTTSAFTTTQPGELLLAFVAADDRNKGQTVTGVTGGGLTWALVRRTNTQRGTSEVWRAFAPAVLSNVSVTATLAQGAAASIVVVTFAGADPSGTNGSGAVGATAGTAGVGAPSATLTTTRNNSWVFGVGNDWDNAIARVPGPNQTMVHQYLPAVGDTFWVQRQTNATAVAGTAVTINDTAPTGDQYNLTLVEILAKP